MDKSRSSQGLLRSPTTPPHSPPIPSVPPEDKAKVDKLMDQVNNIVLSDDVILSKAKEPYMTWCHEACVSSDILKYAVERLHYYWLCNRPSVAKSALFLCANWFFEVDGMKMRQELLLCLQKDFENRLDLQAKSPQKFLNSVAFLVEIFTKVRIENEPMKFLSTPVFQSLEDLLTGDDSEIELFAHLLVGIGPTLQDVCSSEEQSLSTYMPLQNLFCKIRSTLMSRNLSCQSRLWLLFVMDISSSGHYCPPSSSLQKYYQDKENLGPVVNSLLKSLDSAIPSQAEVSPSAPQVQETVSAPLVSKTKEKELDIAEKITEIKISPKSPVTDGPSRITEIKISPKSPVTDGPSRITEIKISPKSPVTDGPSRTSLTETKISPKAPVPDGASRANLPSVDLRHKITPKPLLSDGAVGAARAARRTQNQNEVPDKREGFRSALSSESSKGNRGKSYWLHDDRFDDDDTPVKGRDAGGFSKPRASEGNWRRPTTPKDDQERKSKSEESWRPQSRGNGSRDISKINSAQQPEEEVW